MAKIYDKEGKIIITDKLPEKEYDSTHYHRWTYEDYSDNKLTVKCSLCDKKETIVWTKPLEFKKNKSEIIFTIVMIVLFFYGFCCFQSCMEGGCSNSSSIDYSEKTVTCKICGKSYNSYSDNGRKIKYSGKCVSCYNFHEGAKDALNELPR